MHGHHLEIESCFAVWLPGWTVFTSLAIRADGSESFGAGGVAIALCPAVAAGAMSPIEHKVHVDGRCNSVTTSLSKPSNLFDFVCIINLHNYNFSSSQVRRIGAVLTKRSALDRLNPILIFSLLVGGCNLRATSEQKFHVGRPVPPQSLSRPLPNICRASH